MKLCNTCGEVKTCLALCADMEKELKKVTKGDDRNKVIVMNPLIMQEKDLKPANGKRKKTPTEYDKNWSRNDYTTDYWHKGK